MARHCRYTVLVGFQRDGAYDRMTLHVEAPCDATQESIEDEARRQLTQHDAPLDVVYVLVAGKSAVEV